MLAITLITAAALVATTLAQSTQSAIVTIEASHGGAGNDLTNTTITVPLNKPYTGHALNEVSYLFLSGANNVPVDSITCTPFRYSNGTGTAGLPFNSTSPSLLSTNTVQVGSIVCISGYIPSTPSAGTVNPSSVSISSSVSSSPSSSLSSTLAPSNNLTVASSSSSAGSTTFASSSSSAASAAQTTQAPQTSTFIVTTSPAGGSAVQSTVTSVFVPTASAAAGSATANPGSTGAASTTSAAASLNSASSSANSVSLSGEFFGGLALAGFGLAFVL